jgi:N-acetylmuramoyl-L-alanine amidase
MAASISAQKKIEVLLKFSMQDGLMRIVLETDETFVNRAKITTSASQIKIEFPEPFHLSSEKTLPFEIVPADQSLGINLKEKSEIKFFRLSSPSRLVFDIQKKETAAEKIPGKQPEKRLEQPAEKHAVQIVSKVFVIDAGHGGYDFGITSGDVSEKDISLGLAKDLWKILSKKGKKVFLTRKVDQYISLADRINLVNQKSPDVFISLHFSISENFILYSPKFEEQDSNEIVDFYSLSSRQKKYIEKSKALSDSIEKAIKDEFKANVIRREMPLPILNSVGAASVLIELPSPRFVVYDQQMKARLENSIINGVATYGQ